MVLVSDKPSIILVFYRLNSAIERGTKPDALGWTPCHRTSTSPSPGRGCGASSEAKASGPPRAWRRIAFMPHSHPAVRRTTQRTCRRGSVGYHSYTHGG